MDASEIRLGDVVRTPDGAMWRVLYPYGFEPGTVTLRHLGRPWQRAWPHVETLTLVFQPWFPPAARGQR